MSLDDFFDVIVTHDVTDNISGVDCYNLCETGEIGRTLSAAGGGLNEHIPCVREPVIATTGYYMTVTENGVAPSLLSRDYKDPQIVCVGFDGYNQVATGDISKAITSAATDSDHVPLVFADEY